ncbi:respiratory nitrate reductase 1 subunit alpha, partial [Salmonella enterica subsp. enterica serovar Enteritidis str. CDC_2010K_0956]
VIPTARTPGGFKKVTLCPSSFSISCSRCLTASRWEHLRADCYRLYDGVRHYRHDQLRSWRGVYDRQLRLFYDHRHLGKETDVVTLPIQHDSAAELAQPLDVKDWKKANAI